MCGSRGQWESEQSYCKTLPHFPTLPRLFTYFLYDGGLPVLELNAQKAIQVSYLYGADGVVYRRIHSSNEYEYHHANALGSPVVLTDDSKNVLARYEYDVFGAIRNKTGTSDNTRKFTGKEFDADSNLYYYAARYYDPYIGRFTQRDPAGDGINWYAYTVNNPLKYTDPTGMWFETGLDLAGLGLSIYEFRKDPSLGNFFWMLLDAGAVVIPIVPGTKVGRIAFKWVTKSDPLKIFGEGKQFTKNYFRDNLIKATEVGKEVTDNHQAHHLIPQHFRDEMMEKFGINVDHPSLMAWWKKETHQANWKKWNDAWDYFFLENPNATKNDVLLNAQKMADEWKDEHFYNKEYYLKSYQLVPHSAGNYDDPN